MNDTISRRTIVSGVAAAFAGATTGDCASAVQTRMLGATGIRTTIIGLGCGESWWKACGTEDRAAEVLNAALDSGIRYLDTGQTYGKGLSETWIGNILKDRRRGVFLATKVSTRDGQEALRETERCLERLKTDKLDLIHIHALKNDDDLAVIENKDGVLDAVHRLRDQKITGFIGITSHMNPVTLRAAIQRHDFDCVQMALNAAMQGHYEGASSRPGHSFESITLPAAVQKNMGVIAMKVTGRGQLVGDDSERADARQLIRYALSLPVALAVVGMGEVARVKQNAEVARSFVPMPAQEMRRLASRIAAANKTALDRTFANHIDG